MIIGYLSFEIYLPYSHSLKEKRKRLESIKNRLKHKYNVAFAELDFHNKWQRSLLGIVTLNNQQRIIEKMFHKILKEVDENIDGEILKTEIRFM
jgi:uncharacterized protein YlxP (DUF503 family)